MDVDRRGLRLGLVRAVGLGPVSLRPMGVRPDLEAHAVLALVETDFITGQTIRVDGGRHVR